MIIREDAIYGRQSVDRKDSIIIELNGIKDANLIYVGQKLLLPIDE